MKILILGSLGFIGSHLKKELGKLKYEILTFDKDDLAFSLENKIKDADFIFHLAGVNRSNEVIDFYYGNILFTDVVIKLMQKYHKKCPLIFTSSIQVETNPKSIYSISKINAENILNKSGLNVLIYRLANVFGNNIKPNYNSVFATFSYNIIRNLPVKLENNNQINFIFIDDVIKDFISLLDEDIFLKKKRINYISPTYYIRVKDLYNLLTYFHEETFSPRHLPFLKNDFEYKAYISFLSYYPQIAPLKDFEDERGKFFELFKDDKFGQISLNITYPHKEKGGHYHTYKNEVFYVFKGESKITLIDIFTKKEESFIMNEQNRKFIDIPLYKAHYLLNDSNENSYTLIWINKVYDEENGDTYKYVK